MRWADSIKLKVLQPRKYLVFLPKQAKVKVVVSMANRFSIMRGTLRLEKQAEGRRFRVRSLYHENGPSSSWIIVPCQSECSLHFQPVLFQRLFKYLFLLVDNFCCRLSIETNSSCDSFIYLLNLYIPCLRGRQSVTAGRRFHQNEYRWK